MTVLQRFAAAGEIDIELDRRDLLARRRPPEPGSPTGESRKVLTRHARGRGQDRHWGPRRTSSSDRLGPAGVRLQRPGSSYEAIASTGGAAGTADSDTRRAATNPLTWA